MKESLRRKEDDKEEDSPSKEADDETSELLSDARKRVKRSSAAVSSKQTPTDDSILPAFAASKETLSHADLVTRTAEHHPEEASQEERDDGIFRDKTRNKLLAGPIKAAAHVRVTARFDYQPDICKDYKETGFCGFGDTCIYLHDRSDTLSGWQLEQQYQQQQQKKRDMEKQQMDDFLGKSPSDDDTKNTDDGLPFACFLCRQHFKDPIVTNCQHYFCQDCILKHVKNTETCPICQKDMYGVFNQPTKLIAKRRKLLGKGSWLEYFQSQSQS